MGPLVLPAIVLTLGGFAYHKVKHKRRGMTPERKKILDAALNTNKNPNELRKLADSFEKEGQRAAATLLRKRAKLRELPPEVKQKRRDIMRDALKSTNAKDVDKLAACFEEQGATGCAEMLRKHADAIRKAA